MAFPRLQLGMAEYLALGGATRTGDLSFGPTPERPETWLPPDAPLVTLPVLDDDLERLLDAASAADDGRAATPHLQILLRGSGADVGGTHPKGPLLHDGVECVA